MPRYDGVISNEARRVRVTVDGVGSFTKGNARSIRCDRSVFPDPTFFATRSSGGFFGSNGAKPTDDYRGPRRKAKAAAREGRLCPSCGLLRSVLNRCECNS